jgi:uncharacterized protein with PhoU and TrkA domain
LHNLEKIEYKPVSVKEVLTEMKDLSEIMLDLAYSAVLFHSVELAEEVLELEERIDTLSYLLDMSIMLAARDAEDAEALAGIATVAAATNEISDAAADIASLVLQEIGLHSVIREAFQKIEERLMRTEIKSGSLLDRKKIGELELAANIGVDIIAIRRGKEWIIDPELKEEIMEGDFLIVRGAPLGIQKLRDIASGKTRTFDRGD